MNEAKYIWDKQLPKHTKKDYYECYAKIFLEEMFSGKFKDLKIEDKPDLQSEDNKFGVEVTRAEDENELEAEELYYKINSGICRNPKKILEKYSRGDIVIENGILSCSGVDSFDLILKAFQEKIDKLNNGNYKKFEENYLFVFSDILASDRMLKQALEDMVYLQKNQNEKFVEVFILVPGEHYNFNLKSKKYYRRKVRNKEQHLHACKARELVEIYEDR